MKDQPGDNDRDHCHSVQNYIENTPGPLSSTRKMLGNSTQRAVKQTSNTGIKAKKDILKDQVTHRIKSGVINLAITHENSPALRNHGAPGAALGQLIQRNSIFTSQQYNRRLDAVLTHS